MNESLRELLGRYQALESRDRRILLIGGIVVLLTILYLAVWEPLAAAHSNAHDRLEQARATAERLEVLGAQTGPGAPRSGATTVIGAGQSLLSVVDQAGKNSTLGKPLTRIQPDGDDTVRVWLEAVSFDALVRWIDELKKRYALEVVSAEIENESAGVVNARLSLERAR